jgi:hypothetical protein
MQDFTLHPINDTHFDFNLAQYLAFFQRFLQGNGLNAILPCPEVPAPYLRPKSILRVILGNK